MSEKNKSEWRDSHPQILMQESSRENLNNIASLQEQALANKQMIQSDQQIAIQMIDMINQS